MKIDEQTTFPYPVLGVKDDIMPLPKFTYVLEEDENNYLLSINIDLNNFSIRYYIETCHAAVYVCEVDCSSTFYRVSYKNKQPSFYIKIPKNAVYKDVNVLLTVTTTQCIENYVNSSSNEDYQGFKVNLEKGDLLAYIGTLTIQTDIKADEFKTISSFIHFRMGKPKSDVSYYLEGDDIEIRIPEEMYQNYVKKLKIDRFKPAIMASIINEALIFALLNYQNHSNRRWARILASAMTSMEDLKEYDVNDLSTDIYTAFDVARVILKNPHNLLFESLAELTDDND